jgi:hypothetical protein
VDEPPPGTDRGATRKVAPFVTSGGACAWPAGERGGRPGGIFSRTDRSTDAGREPATMVGRGAETDQRIAQGRVGIRSRRAAHPLELTSLSSARASNPSRAAVLGRRHAGSPGSARPTSTATSALVESPRRNLYRGRPEEGAPLPVIGRPIAAAGAIGGKSSGRARWVGTSTSDHRTGLSRGEGVSGA